MRKLRTESERKRLIEDWQSSGIPQDEWCINQGVSRHTFKKWLSQYRKEQKESSSFISLDVEEASGIKSSSPFELVYPNGVQLRFSKQLPLEQLKPFLHLYDH